ncbi:MAG: hypothetical protein QFX33_02185 [Candidatus Nezhaarchaeota archaeon]|nr:hypothetical protein [Candidatus Nezhaarchaeota archaeon]
MRVSPENASMYSCLATLRTKQAREKEAGAAVLGGRTVFLDEEVVLENRFSTLAHEVGHILSLGHHEEQDNVMHPVCGGSELSGEQCAKVNEYLKARRLCDERSVKRSLERVLAEARRRLEELRRRCGDEDTLEKRVRELQGQAERLEAEANTISVRMEKVKDKKALERLWKERGGKLEEARRIRSEVEALQKLEEGPGYR